MSLPPAKATRLQRPASTKPSTDSRHVGPRRLGFLIPEFPQQTHIAWWRVSEGMRRAGVHVELLSTRAPRQDCPHPQLRRAASETTYLWPPAARDALEGMRAIHRLPGAALYVGRLTRLTLKERARAVGLIAAALRLRRIARERRLDHVFVHSCADAAHVAALARVLGGPAYSLRLGGDLEVYGGNHRSKMRRATLVVPAARAYVTTLVNEVGVDPERILWSWVGTDTELFCPPPARGEHGACRIITVARLNPAKGFQVVLPALARLRAEGVAFTYEIVGEGPYEGEIRQVIRELGLESYVRLHGSRSTEDVARLLAGSDVFVLPTSGIGEGTPAAVCEAMSAGLPIVATDVGGVSDMITEGEHGFVVPPGDPVRLAAALKALALDPAGRERMGAASRARALALFDCRAVAVRILEKIGSLEDRAGTR